MGWMICYERLYSTGLHGLARCRRAADALLVAGLAKVSVYMAKWRCEAERVVPKRTLFVFRLLMGWVG